MTEAPPNVSPGRLAADGGEPLVRRGYVARSRWPLIEEEDVERVLAQLRSGLLTEMADRTLVRSFESEIASYCRTRHALAVNSGTAALHCALAGVGVGAGDEVVVPALAYIACAAAVVHHQGIPVFADVDPATSNLTAETVAAALTPRTRAVLAVHLHGQPCDLDPILAVARRHGVAVVEDFSQAFGATYRGRPVGGFGAAGAASLMAGKNLPAAGEAGVLVTNDRDVRNRAAQLKCFAEEVLADGSYRTQQATLGWNYRANLLALAMASQQLFRLDDYNNRRRANAGRLTAALAELPGLNGPADTSASQSVYHMYRFRFNPDRGGFPLTPDQFREGLKRVFADEGLALVEFQNTPLPGHPLLRREVGYGRGCPWACHGRADMTYRIDDYPASLDVIRHTLVVGYPAQATLCNDRLVDLYIDGFRKVYANRDAFVRIACAVPAAAPWDMSPPRVF